MEHFLIKKLRYAMTVMWLVGSKPIRSYVTRKKHLFRMFWLTANLWQLESILSSNDVMCYALWRYLPSLPYQFSILILNTSRVDSPASSRCRPLSCLLAVLGMFLANSLPASASFSWNGRKCFAFCSRHQNNSFLSPGLSWLTVQ